MKKIVLIILLFTPTFVIAQTKEQIEKQVEESSFAIRKAVMEDMQNGSNTDISSYIDILEKYLHQQPTDLSLVVKYFAIFTLNGYYIDKQMPKVNYKELIEALMVTQKFDRFYDPFYINCAYGLGLEYEKTKLYTRAIDMYELVLKAFTKVYQGNHGLFDYNIQKQISSLYFLYLKNHKEWLIAQKKVTNIIEQIAGNDSEFYITDLDYLSLAYQYNNQYVQSDSCLIICQNYFERNNLLGNEKYIDIIRKRAEIKQNRSVQDITESINLYNKILSFQKEGTPEYANTLYEIATCYQNQNDYKNVKKYADKSLATAQRNPNDNIDLLFNLIMLYKLSNGIEQAKKILNIIDLTHVENISTLSKLSYIYALDGNYELSRKYIEQAKKLADKKLKSDNLVFDFDDDISMLCQALLALNEYEDGIKYEEKSLERLKKILGKEHDIVLQIMLSLSTSYAIIGNYDKAFEILQDSILQSENNPYLHEVLEKQAELLFDMGDLEQAISSYENFLSKEISPAQKCRILNSVNGLYMAHADLLRTEGEKENYEIPKLLKNAFEALELSEQIYGINTNEYITSLQIVAGIYSLSDSLDLAKKYADECLKVIKESDLDYLNRALYLEALATVYVQIKDYHKALKLVEDGMNIEKKINKGRLTKEDISYHVLSEAYLGNKDFSKAQYYYSALFSILSEEIQKKFSFMTTKQRENFWRMYREQLFNSGKYVNENNTNTSFLATVYDAALFSKSILLNSTIELTKLIQDKPELQKKFEDMRRRRVAIQKKLEDAVNKEREAEQLERELVKNSSEYGDYTNYLKVNWKQIKEQLKDNEIAIEFIEFEVNKDKDSTMYAAVAIRNNWDYPRMVTLFEKNEFLNMQVGNTTINKSFLINIKKQDNSKEQDNRNTSINELYQNGQVLYNVIWKPLEKYIKAKDNIYFSPVGILNFLSIEYLTDDNPNLEDVKLYRCSSTREILNKGKEAKYETAVLYGGIRYTAKKLLEQNGVYKQISVDSISSNIKDIRNFIDNYNQSIGNLLSKETDSISSILKNSCDSVYYYTDITATKESFKTLSGNSPSIIHLSTHGFSLPYTAISKTEYSFARVNKKMDELALNNSFLLFAGAKNKEYQPGVSDGILTATEISQLDLRNTSLVVLSACQSGIGEVSGDGVFGLQRGFKKAGAKTIVMSLWSVPEKSTQILMTQFYSNLVKGMSKQASFQNAIGFLKNYTNDGIKTPYNLPECWAGFIMLDGI